MQGYRRHSRIELVRISRNACYVNESSELSMEERDYPGMVLSYPIEYGCPKRRSHTHRERNARGMLRSCMRRHPNSAADVERNAIDAESIAGILRRIYGQKRARG